MRIRDITGQVFGRLVAMHRTDNDPSGKTRWSCKCECGAISKVTMLNLVSGTTKSCGCLKHQPSQRRADLSGVRFGLLTVETPNDSKSWKCRCDCGADTVVSTVHLTREHTKSCGCLTPSVGSRATGPSSNSAWVRAVKREANNVCDACGSSENVHAHHLLPFAQYPAFRHKTENGAALCRQCHSSVHGRIRRGMSPGRAFAEQVAEMQPELQQLVSLLFPAVGSKDIGKVIRCVDLLIAPEPTHG